MRDSSVEMLQGYLTSILQSIVASVDQCPPVMRVVFKQLHKRVEEQFVQPENEVGGTLEAGSKRKEMTLHEGKMLRHVLYVDQIYTVYVITQWMHTVHPKHPVSLFYHS